MKRLFITTLFGCLLGFLLATTTIPSQLDLKPEITAKSLVDTLQFLNTHEYSYHEEAGRFASNKDLVAFLRTKKLFNRSPINLQYPGVLELAITTSVDGHHYSISLKPRVNPVSDTWRCAPAAFTDDTGVIFLGSALGCGDSSRYLQPLQPVQ